MYRKIKRKKEKCMCVSHNTKNIKQTSKTVENILIDWFVSCVEH